MEGPVLRVLPFVQRYAWGSAAEDSLVAAIAKRTTACVNYKPQLQQQQQEQQQQGAAADDDTAPFAELWIGTHPNGCSHVSPLNQRSSSSTAPKAAAEAAAESIPLIDYLLQQQQQQQQQQGLPFLLKVLSVAAPLSLQSHPDKQLAARLHADRPLEFRDANHKPEMAVALGPFAALAGFRPAAAVAALAVRTPELQQALGEDFLNSPQGKQFTALAQQQQQQQEEAALLLKAAFAALLRADTAQQQQQQQRQQQQQAALRALHARLKKNPPPAPSHQQQQQQQQQEAEWVALQLLEVYPEDIGCFAAFFLNLVLLQDGESLFVPPNYLHCYLKGHCVELMAASDNVIRGGLTSKHMDASLLLNTLNFSPQTQTPVRAVPTTLPDDPQQQLLLLQQLTKEPIQQQQQQQQLQQQQQHECVLYAPPLWRFPEFCTAALCLPRGLKRTLALLQQRAGVVLVLWSPFPAVMNVTDTSSSSSSSSKKREMSVQLQSGDIFYVASGSTLVFDTESSALKAQAEERHDALSALQKANHRSDCLRVFVATGGF